MFPATALLQEKTHVNAQQRRVNMGHHQPCSEIRRWRREGLLPPL